MKTFLLCTLVAVAFYSCSSSEKSEDKKEKDTVENTSDSKFTTGHWRLCLEIGDRVLPFGLELNNDKGSLSATFINGTERIESNEIILTGDSIRIQVPVFDSELVGQFTSKKELQGNWYNHARKDPNYHIPFTAKHGETFRFDASPASGTNFDGKWEVTFSPNTSDEYKAVGLFTQTEQQLAGTFLTETGDYRFLAGEANGASLNLSCFDGAHAFLFNAEAKGDSLFGTFWSGNHYSEPWVAIRNDGFELSNPDSLTHIKAGEELTFTFPNLDSNMVSFPSEAYNDKVVIVQIMGSWCPNCKDETAFYSELYEKYHHKGLEIISLGFESKEGFSNAKASVQRLKEHFNSNYEFLIAGGSDKKEASELLHMFNKIMSYPTSVFIGRDGEVKKIHTGFYGPGTGKYYDRYVEEIEIFLEQLLAEPS